MSDIVSLEEARAQLRLGPADDDADVSSKLEQATDIVIDFIKKPDHGWTVDTVPPRVRAAVLIVLTQLYDGRGEIVVPKALLWRLRDPALA